MRQSTMCSENPQVAGVRCKAESGGGEVKVVRRVLNMQKGLYFMLSGGKGCGQILSCG